MDLIIVENRDTIVLNFLFKCLTESVDANHNRF
jgi:hypothetical protein